jgi:hypothetical protein
MYETGIEGVIPIQSIQGDVWTRGIRFQVEIGGKKPIKRNVGSLMSAL